MKKIDKVILMNFKRHEKYIGTYHGNHFIVFGLNGSGKTTVIDAIKRTFGQKAKVGEPIRTGADGATIQTYIMDDDGTQYCMEEKFTKSTGRSRLRFYLLNGNSRDELTPALERFYKIFGEPIDFSPLIDMDGEKQFEFMKNNLGFNLQKYEHDYDAIYDDRTLIGREIDMLKAKLIDPNNSVVADDIKTYTEEKNAAELLAKKTDMLPLFEEKQAAEQRAEQIKTVNEREAAVDRQIIDLQNQIAALQERKASFAVWREANPAIEIEPIEQRIVEATQANDVVDKEIVAIDNHNKMYRKVQEHLTATKDLEQKQKDYKEKTSDLKKVEEAMRQVLTQLPISSLVPDLELVSSTTTEVDEKTKKEKKVVKKGLMLEGLPFSRAQHSYGKLLKAIIKMSAHFNADKINFIPIHDWNLLDPVSQAEVLEFAKENPDLNIQFGIERVDSNKEIMTEVIEFTEPVNAEPA